MNLTEDASLAVSDLRRAVAHPRTADPTRTRALFAITQMGLRDEEMLACGPSQADQLRRLYARRLRRSLSGGPRPHGTADLVHALSRLPPSAVVLLVVREKGGVLAYFFLNDSLTWLIGCVVARSLSLGAP